MTNESKATGPTYLLQALQVQFQLTLRAIAMQVSARYEAQGTQKPPALRRVEQLLAEDATWDRCYEVEQQLVQLFDPVTLRNELERRVVEARGALGPEVFAHYQMKVQGAAHDEQAQRALLARLVNDLQWRYTVGEARRNFMRDLTTMAGVAMLLVSAAFVVAAAVSARVDELLAVAAASGAFGASFSMLTALKKRFDQSSLDDLKLEREPSLLASRIAIGAIAGTVLYFFIRSGLLEGKLFPKFDGDGADTPAVGFALLIVWCFIAGFSEKLIPSLLAQTERRLNDASRSQQQPLPQPQPSPGARPSEPDASAAAEAKPNGEAPAPEAGSSEPPDPGEPAPGPVGPDAAGAGGAGSKAGQAQPSQ